MLNVIGWLHSDVALKAVAALMAIASAVVVAAPAHTVAHKVAAFVLMVGSILGVTSSTDMKTAAASKNVVDLDAAKKALEDRLK